MIGNKTKDSTAISLNSEDDAIKDNNNVAQKFNEYFSKIGERLSSNFNDTEAFQRYLDDDHSGISFHLRAITLEELHSVLKTLINTAGADDLLMYVYPKNFSVLGSTVLWF